MVEIYFFTALCANNRIPIETEDEEPTIITENNLHSKEYYYKYYIDRFQLLRPEEKIPKENTIHEIKEIKQKTQIQNNEYIEMYKKQYEYFIKVINFFYRENQLTKNNILKRWRDNQLKRICNKKIKTLLTVTKDNPKHIMLENSNRINNALKIIKNIQNDYIQKKYLKQNPDNSIVVKLEELRFLFLRIISDKSSKSIKRPLYKINEEIMEKTYIQKKKEPTEKLIKNYNELFQLTNNNIYQCEECTDFLKTIENQKEQFLDNLKYKKLEKKSITFLNKYQHKLQTNYLDFSNVYIINNLQLTQQSILMNGNFLKKDISNLCIKKEFLQQFNNNQFVYKKKYSNNLNINIVFCLPLKRQIENFIDILNSSQYNWPIKQNILLTYFLKYLNRDYSYFRRKISMHKLFCFYNIKTIFNNAKIIYYDIQNIESMYYKLLLAKSVVNEYHETIRLLFQKCFIDFRMIDKPYFAEQVPSQSREYKWVFYAFRLIYDVHKTEIENAHLHTNVNKEDLKNYLLQKLGPLFSIDFLVKTLSDSQCILKEDLEDLQNRLPLNNNVKYWFDKWYTSWYDNMLDKKYFNHKKVQHMIWKRIKFFKDSLRLKNKFKCDIEYTDQLLEDIVAIDPYTKKYKYSTEGYYFTKILTPEFLSYPPQLQNLYLKLTKKIHKLFESTTLLIQMIEDYIKMPSIKSSEKIQEKYLDFMNYYEYIVKDYYCFKNVTKTKNYSLVFPDLNIYKCNSAYEKKDFKDTEEKENYLKLQKERTKQLNIEFKTIKDEISELRNMAHNIFFPKHNSQN